MGSVSIYFAGTYKPIMCGIADYTSFITPYCPPGRWGVLSFDLQKYGDPLTGGKVTTEPVWYGIPGRKAFSAAIILEGLKQLGADNRNSVVWFQHEHGIWQDDQRFITMLKELTVRRVVSFHTLHFQSEGTPFGLRSFSYDFLRELLPHVDAITVFSRGVYDAVTRAFPAYYGKVHILKHGIHLYPEMRRLSRKEAKQGLEDYLLYESDLDQKTKEAIRKQRIFADPNTVVVGQTGFLSPAKNSELLYPVRDALQKLVPQKRVVVVRIGTARDETQRIYASQLRRQCNDTDKFLFEVPPHLHVLPLSLRAFDVNFYWPGECTQSGILAHALGAGAVVAGRDMEGVGETLRDAGESADTDLGNLLLKIRDIMLSPELGQMLEEKALTYATEFCWERQARRHYELAELILPKAPVPAVLIRRWPILRLFR